MQDLFTADRASDVIGQGCADTPEAMRAARKLISSRERQVLELSLQDHETSLIVRPLWPRSVSSAFGFERPTPLAEEPLQEFRKFAIRTRKAHYLEPEALDRFLRSGYTRDQAVLILNFVAHRSPAPHVLLPQFAGWMCLAAVGLGTYLLVQPIIREVSVSAMIAGTVFATLASFMAPREGLRR